MPTPRTLIVLQSTSFCNIDCSYCYLPNRSLNNKMSLAVLEKIVSEVFASKFVSAPFDFLWHVGEPLSVPVSYYEEAISIINHIGLEAGIEYTLNFQTNATLITEKWAHFFKKNQVKIGISLDGPEFIHDRNRVDKRKQGTYSQVMAGIKILQEYKIPFSVIMVVTDYSLDYADEICDFFIENKISDIGFNIDEMEGTHTQTSFSENTIGRYRSFIRKLLKRSVEAKGILRIREIWTNLNHFTYEVKPHEIYSSTNTPFRILNFDSVGNYSTYCPELLAAKSIEYNNFLMGNIMVDGLEKFENNVIFKKTRAEINQGKELCKQSCDYWSFCGGGNPSNKFFENGTFESTETIMCRFLKKEIIDLLIEYFEEENVVN